MAGLAEMKKGGKGVKSVLKKVQKVLRRRRRVRGKLSLQSVAGEIVTWSNDLLDPTSPTYRRLRATVTDMVSTSV